MRRMYSWLLVSVIFVHGACEKSDIGEGLVVYPPMNAATALSTDKAIYSPGEEVKFSLDQNAANLQVRYKHLGELIDENALSGQEWSWTPPGEDFRGYMAEIVDVSGEEEKIVAAIGVDVSSDWTKFPRYGFLSKFPDMDREEMVSVIENLNRHHINGIQFYDWHYKHHQPLAGTPENPDMIYKDIINRDIYFSTVEQYIDIAHEYNMKAMFYNLIYGAFEDASADGVSEEWYLYTDDAHTNKDMHPLNSPPFVSDILILDPSNTGWQEYIINENQRVYDALPFDGFHMDQLGNRNKSLYTYSGDQIDVGQTFKPFIEAVKESHNDKVVVLNAVDQYGQDQIAEAPTGFLYSEVWSPASFEGLANVILANDNFSNQTKNSVLAAYMNYNLANSTGSFNTPAVLLTDAVIFAFGGAHLELGEHMLGKEYFPNSNLSMKDDLKEALKSYYDFMVAYENLFRDGGNYNDPELSSNGPISLNNWPPQQGQVSIIGKQVGNRQIIQLINFSNATTMEWRDNNGSQAYPVTIEDIELNFKSSGSVKKMWFASPDYNFGASQELEFMQSGDQVSFTLPHLQYWDIVVVEY